MQFYGFFFQETSPFWPRRLKTFRAGAALRLFFVVLYDIVVANVTVARVVLGDTRAIQSQFVDVPLDTRDPFVATILGSIIRWRRSRAGMRRR